MVFIETLVARVHGEPHGGDWRCAGLVVGVVDAPHAHEPHALAHALVHEVPVLSGPHVHAPAPVLGLLVHQPVAVHHVAGHAVGHAVAVHDIIAVVHHLVHLAAEVVPLVDPHPVLAAVLEGGEHCETLWELT